MTEERAGMFNKTVLLVGDVRAFICSIPPAYAQLTTVTPNFESRAPQKTVRIELDIAGENLNVQMTKHLTYLMSGDLRGRTVHPRV